jgi:hypothetical protein
MIDALCGRGHTPYREIGHRAVSFVMDRSGIEYSQDEVRWLVGEIERLKPFPDVIAGLERLKAAGYGLHILSNGDRDMLEAAAPHIGFPFDSRISVQEAGYFKPAWQTYALQHAVRRQPCFRLHRGQELRHAHGVHRPEESPLWRDPVSAGPGSDGFHGTGGGVDAVGRAFCAPFARAGVGARCAKFAPYELRIFSVCPID